MFTLMKVGVIDKRTIERRPSSIAVVEAFMETGWQEAELDREGARAADITRLINRCCERNYFPVYARTCDGKVKLGRYI